MVMLERETGRPLIVQVGDFNLSYEWLTLQSNFAANLLSPQLPRNFCLFRVVKLGFVLLLIRLRGHGILRVVTHDVYL